MHGFRLVLTGHAKRFVLLDNKVNFMVLQAFFKVMTYTNTFIAHGI